MDQRVLEEQQLNTLNDYDDFEEWNEIVLYNISL